VRKLSEIEQGAESSFLPTDDSQAPKLQFFPQKEEISSLEFKILDEPVAR